MMAQGVYQISRLNKREYDVAMAAIKDVRGHELKNAYVEGWNDGFFDCQRRYRGDRPNGEVADWERSHSKALYEESKVQEPK